MQMCTYCLFDAVQNNKSICRLFAKRPFNKAIFLFSILAQKQIPAATRLNAFPLKVSKMMRFQDVYNSET